MAVIVQLLGHVPAPGSTIEIPEYIVARFSYADVSHAKACARRFGLKVRVVR